MYIQFEFIFRVNASKNRKGSVIFWLQVHNSLSMHVMSINFVILSEENGTRSISSVRATFGNNLLETENIQVFLAVHTT